MCPTDSIRVLRRCSALRRMMAAVCLAACCALSGCQQDMANQPKQTPLSASSFFPDGSARPLVSGTVPRGSVDQDYLDVPDNSNQFPIPVTEELLARGRERFNIYCSECHGYTGKGDGMIVRRGFTKPPSYFSEELMNAPVGHFYTVITNGYGMMPSYAAQVPRRDRWAIIAYIRALQLSQYAPVSQLPPDDVARIQAAGQSPAPGKGAGSQ